MTEELRVPGVSREWGCAVSCLPSTPAARTVPPLLSQAVLCLSHCAPGVQLAGAMVEVKEAIALWGWFMAGTCIPVADY